MKKKVNFTKKDKDPKGGLSDAGRAKAKAAGMDLKRPVSKEQAAKSDKAAARRKSFCARMEGNPGPDYKYVDKDRDG
jgi:hypothetical protein